MAIQTKTIKQKMNSIGNIKKITKTMEMVSVSKMKRAVSNSISSREYSRYALELLVTLAKERNVSHPLLEKGAGKKILLVIVASNKGLCGGYNVNISKSVSKFKSTLEDEEIDCITIGKQAERIANRNKLNIIASISEFKENITLDEIEILKKIIFKEFLELKNYKSVYAVYTQFVKQLEYKPNVREIIPVSLKTTRNLIEEIAEGREEERFDKRSMALYLFEPSEERVLDKVIPDLISAIFLQIMLEAQASEHSSRMIAMKNATDNAGELLEDLSLTYNRARQAGITQEVAEIIGGAEALNTN
ncbi:MAG: ATP synthase F1 subunit gamma [Candidatus Pacebacteria bacterium]|nr:ATP synthase F1 subunit gamma [Candidatus Paceibacterota bacterium]